MHVHRDQMRRCLGARLTFIRVLAQMELEHTLQGCFDGGDVNLAITLRAVPVAARKQCTPNENRQIKR